MIYKNKTKTQLILEIFLSVILTYYAVSFAKAFILRAFIHDGSFSEFLSNITDILISFAVYVGIFILLVKDIRNKKETPSHDKMMNYISLAVALSSMVALFYIFNYDMTLNAITNNAYDVITENAYDVVVIPVLSNIKFYIFDIMIIISLAFIFKKYKLLTSIKYVLFFKVLVIISLYVAYLGVIKVTNEPFTYKSGSFIPSTLYCENKYLVNNYGVLSFKDCPYKNNTALEKVIHTASDGSYLSLISVIDKKEISLKKLAEIGKSYYDNNSYLEKTSWVEDNIPSLYEKTFLSRSKEKYMSNKILDAKVIYAIETDNQTYLDTIIAGGKKNAHSPFELALFKERTK